jgi:hypothetical protein
MYNPDRHGEKAFGCSGTVSSQGNTVHSPAKSKNHIEVSAPIVKPPWFPVPVQLVHPDGGGSTPRVRHQHPLHCLSQGQPVLNITQISPSFLAATNSGEFE